MTIDNNQNLDIKFNSSVSKNFVNKFNGRDKEDEQVLFNEINKEQFAQNLGIESNSNKYSEAIQFYDLMDENSDDVLDNIELQNFMNEAKFLYSDKDESDEVDIPEYNIDDFGEVKGKDGNKQDEAFVITTNKDGTKTKTFYDENGNKTYGVNYDKDGNAISIYKIIDSEKSGMPELSGRATYDMDGKFISFDSFKK